MLGNLHTRTGGVTDVCKSNAKFSSFFLTSVIWDCPSLTCQQFVSYLERVLWKAKVISAVSANKSFRIHWDSLFLHHLAISPIPADRIAGSSRGILMWGRKAGTPGKGKVQPSPLQGCNQWREAGVELIRPHLLKMSVLKTKLPLFLSIHKAFSNIKGCFLTLRAEWIDSLVMNTLSKDDWQ